MKVQSYHLDIRHVLSLINDLQHVSHVNTELVLGQTGCNICMGMGTYIGIQAKSYTCNLAFSCCQFVDDFQFRNAFHIKAKDVVVQSKVYLPITFAYTGKNDFRTGKTCFDRCFYLTTTYAVCT